MTPPPRAARPNGLRGAALWIIVGLGLVIAALGGRPPAPKSLAAPADLFSASRAMADVRAIGAAAHPTGSEAIGAVRGHVIARLNEVGVAAAPHAGMATVSPPWAPQNLAAAEVQNVVGVLPGRDPAAPALLVMAHYDSVANSPGAADDAAGVAATIEIARALAADARTRGRAARDVIFLATDAEEAGLLGARAFFASDPLARHVGVVINLEARGDAGRAAMFQTGPDNGALMRLYAATAERPFAHSLSGFVARVLPNDTDFSVARDHGLGGFNFAFLGDQLAYHTAIATPAHLDPRSLQSLGGQALPLARALARAAALPKPAPDWSYAEILGRTLIGYPAGAGGWLVLLLCAASGGLAARSARRQGLLSAPDVVRGFATALLASLGSTLALRLAGRMLGGAAPARLYGLLVRYDLLFAGAALLMAAAALAAYVGATRGAGRRWLAAAALFAGFGCSAFGGLDVAGFGLGAAVAALGWRTLATPVSVWGAWFGALALAALTAVFVQILAPPAALVVTWPLLLGCLGALAVFGLRLPRLGLALAGVAATVAVALVGGWCGDVFIAVGASAPEALAVMATPALAALTPFVRLWAGTPGAARAAWALAAAGGLALGIVGRLGGTPARPVPTQAYYVIEPAKAQAWWAAPELDRWTRSVLAKGRAPPRAAQLGADALSPAPVWTTSAPLAPLDAPVVTAFHDAGRLVIDVRSPLRTRSLGVTLSSETALTDPRLDARTVRWPARPGAPRRIVFEAPPPEGVTLSFDAPDHGGLDVSATALSDGWPSALAPPPPVPPGLAPWRGSGTTRVIARTRVVW